MLPPPDTQLLHPRPVELAFEYSVPNWNSRGQYAASPTLLLVEAHISIVNACVSEMRIEGGSRTADESVLENTARPPETATPDPIRTPSASPSLSIVVPSLKL